MILTNVIVGRTTKSCVVHDIPPDTEGGVILDAVIAHANETRSSLFGWIVERVEDTDALVILYTD